MPPRLPIDDAVCTLLAERTGVVGVAESSGVDAPDDVETDMWRACAAAAVVAIGGGAVLGLLGDARVG